MDMVTGTSDKMNRMNDELHARVQIELKHWPPLTVTVRPGGRPTTLRFDAVPVKVLLEGYEKPSVLCLQRAAYVDTTGDKSTMEMNRGYEILGHSETLSILFSSDGQTLLHGNVRAYTFYNLNGAALEEGKQGDGQRKMTLRQLLESCLWTSSDELAEMEKDILSLESRMEIERMKKCLDAKGRQCWHRMTFIPCYDPPTGNRAVLVNEIDVSELKGTQLELVEAQRARMAFFTSMSHELRTPLTGIIGLTTSLMSDQSLTRHVHGSLKVIKANSSRLALLVGDILDSHVPTQPYTSNPKP